MGMGGHSGGSRRHTGPHSHGIDGWGDTIFGPELRLAHGPSYHLQFSPMFSAPTGRSTSRQTGVFTHYGMQLGSGTWDFWPSITYTGRADRLTWGAQVLGIVRMEEENEFGLSARRRASRPRAGCSYRFANWISASVRGLYTEQGEIEGHYNGAAQSFEPARSPVQLWRPLLGYRLRRQHRGAERAAARGCGSAPNGSSPSRTIRTAISSSATERSGPTRPCRSSRRECGAVPQFFCTMQAPPLARRRAQSLSASARLSAPICTMIERAAPAAQIALRQHEGLALGRAATACCRLSRANWASALALENEVETWRPTGATRRSP